VATLYSALVVTPPAGGPRARGRLLGVPLVAADHGADAVLGRRVSRLGGKAVRPPRRIAFHRGGRFPGSGRPWSGPHGQL